MMSKKIALVLLFIFMLISCLYISPNIRIRLNLPYASSKQLKKIIVKDDRTVRTDYVNSEGIITMAHDLGYATIIHTETDYGRQESFYDDHGNPVTNALGYASVRWEYDYENGLVHVVYLDMNKEPTIISNGYAMEERKLNEKSQEVIIRYYDTNRQPVCSKGFGYGKIIEYDDNDNPYRTIYINAYGEPMMTQEGYAIITRRYYQSSGPEYGKIESENYFDTQYNPVRLHLGHCGLHKEYDEYGRVAVLTYLDKDGNPIIISKGYATVRRTFDDNNQVATEQYFNQNNEPCCLPEGQFGIKWENGQKVYLDADGKAQVSLKFFLYNHSWMVFILAMGVVFLSILVNRQINTLLLIACLLMIIYMTLESRNSIIGQPGIRILQTYKGMLFNSESRASILKNIWLFIPLGAILYSLYPNRKVLFIPIIISILIETIQYCTSIGYCDLSDVVSNGIGGLIGFMIADMLTNMKRCYQKKKQSIPQNS